ncbi:hypothetical protein AK830_g2280 [Neonectria ditissima]|uniref:Uncharacterized protein n=1 Tax=Neonectria ditissima TaxID=78410 RepID=A0A0P7BFR2_9HYPO|nr:hypothetical protein AK830_g2280 [Neonectria ditissima]
MGVIRARGIARKAAAARKQAIKKTPTSTARLYTAWEYARMVTTTARKVRVLQPLEAMTKFLSKAPFRAITNSFTKLRFPSRNPKPTAAPKREEEEPPKPARRPLPNHRPVPTIVVTAPDNTWTIPDVDTECMKPQVPIETQMQYQKWRSGDFLSPMYPIDAIKERRMGKKLARRLSNKGKKHATPKERRKIERLHRTLRRWARSNGSDAFD